MLEKDTPSSSDVDFSCWKYSVEAPMDFADFPIPAMESVTFHHADAIFFPSPTKDWKDRRLLKYFFAPSVKFPHRDVSFFTPEVALLEALTMASACFLRSLKAFPWQTGRSLLWKSLRP